jgi:deoxyribose-phosphate aldolase
MQLDRDKINDEIESIDVNEVNQETLPRIFSLLDLTSLNASDTEESIAFFCEKAQSPLGHVASVCTYPRFTKLLSAQFAGTPIKVSTVANFPAGTGTLESTLVEIGEALENGADEIDVVFPYLRYLSGEKQDALLFVTACKAACGDRVKLKVILETGVFSDTNVIAEASKGVIQSGADFIKTSTGKLNEGATLEAAVVVLFVIKEMSPIVRKENHKEIGFKVAGGIKTIREAAQYLQLADHIMGRDWVSPATFRIGSSKLIDELLRDK